MQIAVVGTGYVGLVTGTCFAESGNQVTCVDIDAAKVEMLQQGQVPIFEPGLAEMVRHNTQAGRLSFTTDLAAAVAAAGVVYLAVGTPSSDDGSADLSALWSVVSEIAGHLRDDALVVVKSTVPVGTNTQVFNRLRNLTGGTVDVASNPEFLKEGAAINDFMYPDRVVVGVRREENAKLLGDLYHPFLRTEKPFLVMSPESAEMTKYVANAFLSTKISFINEMANLCEVLDADINDVRRGIGHDRRIGFAFLFPGVGYGGSCFPKDVRALAALANRNEHPSHLMDAVDAVNQRQKHVLADKVECHFDGQLRDKTIAVWGLAFKPRTDDIREAPALTLIDRLLELGAHVVVHDPEATDNVRHLYGDQLRYVEQPLDALDGADALAINTEWKEYHNPDLEGMRSRMNAAVVFDGRNIYEPQQLAAAGFTYHSIGRRTALPAGVTTAPSV